LRLKCIILPRQARDKHRGTLKKEAFFAGAQANERYTFRYRGILCLSRVCLGKSLCPSHQNVRTKMSNRFCSPQTIFFAAAGCSCRATPRHSSRSTRWPSPRRSCRTASARWCEKHLFVHHLCTNVYISFYQDRLGTNIGKALKKSGDFLQHMDDVGMLAMRARRLAVEARRQAAVRIQVRKTHALCLCVASLFFCFLVLSDEKRR
jgi:hypothetical protein